ncbi:MAG: terminase small subunit [Candidatus Acidiferrales bacterium]
MARKRELNARQQRFAEVYQGNATEAARKAGYEGTDASLATMGQRLLRKVEIRRAIATREKTERREHIATRQERQQFWSAVMADRREKMRDRLRAAELLGKSEGDFIERIEHEVGKTLEDLVRESMKPQEG